VKSFQQYFTLIEGHMPYGNNPFDQIAGKELVFFDTETTGLSPGTSQITEIAAVIIDGDTFERGDSYHVHIKLSDETLSQIEVEKDSKKKFKIENILDMTNYYNSKATVNEKEAIEGLRGFIPEDAILVAHNAPFDLKMVNTRARNNGISPITHFGKVLDTLMMSRQYFIPASQELEAKGDAEAKRYLDVLTKKWNWKKTKRAVMSSRLGDLAKALKDDLRDWHQAMADVNATATLFQKFKQFFDQHFHKGLQDSPDFKRRYARTLGKTRWQN
jgi:DNA polymerase III alpha subunit (gram-positive type)